MNSAYLLTGGNTGNRLENLNKAAALTEAYAGNIIMRSSVYKTAAWGITDQPDFFNQVLLIETSLPPEELMQILLAIEAKMGRKRLIAMGPRNIDIDILFYTQEQINRPELIIPHPRLHLRRFALEPLAEIAPGFMHPVLKKTTSQLLQDCTDNSGVYKIK